jgi:hypothetical protein
MRCLLRHKHRRALRNKGVVRDQARCAGVDYRHWGLRFEAIREVATVDNRAGVAGSGGEPL